MNFNNKLPVYIPWVPFDLADPDGIKHYLQRLGHIKHVQIVKNKHVHSAFVSFNEWYDDIYSREIQNKIVDDNQEARLENGTGYFILLPKTQKQKRNKNKDGQNAARVFHSPPTTPPPNVNTPLPPLTPRILKLRQSTTGPRGIDNRPAWMVK